MPSQAAISLGLRPSPSQAIICLQKAVSSDPHNLEALLALGVSFTNELDQTRALLHLKSWLGSHPDFSTLDVTAEAPELSRNPFVLQKQASLIRIVGPSSRGISVHAVRVHMNMDSRHEQHRIVGARCM